MSRAISRFIQFCAHRSSQTISAIGPRRRAAHHDTPDDLEFVEAVHARMAAKAGEASLDDLLLLLEREPALREINAHVRQKQIAPQGGVALIRCDGGGQYGFGHVKRMITLARALRDREGIGAVFAVNGSEDALSPIHEAGFPGAAVRFP